jgi:hypothetical protein
LLLTGDFCKLSETLKMKSTVKKSLKEGVQSSVLALLTTVLAFVVSWILGEIICGIFNINEESETALVIFIMLINLINAVACFFICRKYYKSIWYVPVLSNVMGIIIAVTEPDIWKGSLWIVLCCGWLLSLATALVGSYSGKNRGKSLKRIGV